MQLLWDGLQEAWRLVSTGDVLVMAAAGRTLGISVLAVVLAGSIGLPLGTLLARRSFPGQALLITLCRAGMALPTVFIGVVCYSIFSRRGVFGPLNLLYTPWVIVIGELMLALPIVVSLTHGAIQALDYRVSETAKTLGAGLLLRGWLYVSEARIGVSLAILTAFARCMTELGIAMMVGGNIAGRTRTLATATALETGKGEFGRGLAMGLILLLMALVVMLVMACFARQEET